MFRVKRIDFSWSGWFMNKSNKVLIVSGVLSVMAAILHIAIIIGGSVWYRFFGAGEEMSTMAEQGSWIPGLMTFGISVVLFVWGIYAFSGAGLIKRLPFLKLALVIISVIYLLRGLGFIPALIIVPELVDGFLVWSSLVSLLLGLAYAAGTKQVWSKLSIN